jgi:hypothetical protein
MARRQTAAVRKNTPDNIADGSAETGRGKSCAALLK